MKRKNSMRKLYLARLVFRVVVLLIAVWFYCFRPEAFRVLEKGEFWERFSPLHLLWLVWVGDMLMQLIPARRYMALGSEKQFARYYRPAQARADAREFLRQSAPGAVKVLVIWVGLTLALGILHWTGVLGREELFLCVCFFYVSDLICVLFWCPFRVFWMKNRCCTTCRIFNWDHMMMFSPFLFLPGGYTWSLAGLAMVILVLWEVRLYRHPERFWERTNGALSCGACTDHLCGRRQTRAV